MKRVFIVFLAVITVFLTVFSHNVNVSAESLYIRKIVSVVYDDSGSMVGDKWAYANYAMQTFCGMLNSEDQLFITYMDHSQNKPKYTPEKVDLSANGIQKSVDKIRNHTDSGSTPYTAVEIAYNKLKSVKDSNPNTQYWLVVITDGSFDECGGMSKAKIKNYLNKNFNSYAGATMPNGTTPQLTFLSIGDVISPDENLNKGIYTYSASNADQIVDAMSEMADRISGRTRLQKSDIKKIDDKTIQVSSTIPLLNIAALVQNSSAKITKAVYSNEKDIPISRKVSLNYPGYSNLIGGAFLIGDSVNVIGSGTYNITFDQKVDLDDVVILFEPALEIRMVITVNGKEISDYSELDNVMEGDKISVSYKIYEMGTNKEIDSSLMPPGTDFEITVSEDGKVADKISGKDKSLVDYILKNKDTEITASVLIDGFNPIDYSVTFTPAKYVPKVTYTMSASFLNNVKSVKYDNIAQNKDMVICFTVYADGKEMKDSNAVKALNPVIACSPQGNSGTLSYSNDGKIMFTPNSAIVPADNPGSFDVDVTCTIDDGTSASEKYTVLVADYRVIPTSATEKIKKTEFFDNQVGVSFYITKDGVKLDKAAVEKAISIMLNEEHVDLKTNIVVAPDGTITVTPYSDEEHKLTFWTWWINWWYYFSVSGDDVVVTLNHSFGTADAKIDVVEESVLYQVLNVYVPLIVEVVILALFVTWIILVVTKPRYVKSAVLFVGDIKYNRESGTHTIRNFSSVQLDKFNKIKKGNGRLKFKKNADIVIANGIKIRADHGGRIICEMLFPWYKSKVEPADTDLVNLKTPKDISDYMTKHKKLEIVEFATTVTVNGEFERGLAPANPKMAKYIVVPDSGNGVSVIDDRRVIRSGKLFVYVNE